MDFREQIDAQDDILRHLLMDPSDKIKMKLQEYGMPKTHEDFEYIEQRIYQDYVQSIDFHRNGEEIQEDALSKGWAPYEQDLSQYPEVFKKYQENYSKYDKVKERFENEDPYEDRAESPFKRRLPKDMSPWEKKYDTMMPRFTGASMQ